METSFVERAIFFVLAFAGSILGMGMKEPHGLWVHAGISLTAVLMLFVGNQRKAWGRFISIIVGAVSAGFIWTTCVAIFAT